MKIDELIQPEPGLNTDKQRRFFAIASRILTILKDKNGGCMLVRDVQMEVKDQFPRATSELTVEIFKKLEKAQIIERSGGMNAPLVRYLKPDKREQHNESHPLVTTPIVKEPPRVIRVPAKPQEPIVEVPKSCVELTVGEQRFVDILSRPNRTIKNTTEEKFLLFIEYGRPNNGDIVKWTNSSNPTVMKHLMALQAKGLITRKSRGSVWELVTKQRGVHSSNVVYLEPERIGLQRAEPPLSTYEPNFNYELAQDGSVVFTGLVHHKKISLTPEEVIKIVETLTMTPLDRARLSIQKQSNTSTLEQVV